MGFRRVHRGCIDEIPIVVRVSQDWGFPSSYHPLNKVSPSVGNLAFPIITVVLDVEKTLEILWVKQVQGHKVSFETSECHQGLGTYLNFHPL